MSQQEERADPLEEYAKPEYYYQVSGQRQVGPFPSSRHAYEHAAKNTAAPAVHLFGGSHPPLPWKTVDGYSLVGITKKAFGYDLTEDLPSRWPEVNKEEMAELTESVRNVYRAWIERHGLLPDWAVIDLHPETVPIVRT